MADHAPPNLAEALFAGDHLFWFETLRLLGATDFGGAQVGEVLATAATIAPGDAEDWFRAWFELAGRVMAEADVAMQRRHRISAREGWLRASNYFRAAEFFLHANPGDKRINAAYERSYGCFRRAIAQFDCPIEPVEIPYENTTLPGFFYRPDGTKRLRPTIIMHSGFDGSAAELHFTAAWPAVERGYNVLSFDGPGQFAALHREGLHFRPDWENVVSPVIDFALGLASVDASRIALMGLSLGGLLAPRAAAFDRRIAACIANDGLYDYGAPALKDIPEEHRAAVAERFRAESDPELDEALARAMQTSAIARWAMTHGMYAMGKATPRAYVAASLDYNLRDGIAEQIACPTLVCEAEEDLFFKGQPQELYDHLTCPKTLMNFTSAEGAGSHCHVESVRLSSARILDWLSDVLDYRA